MSSAVRRRTVEEHPTARAVRARQAREASVGGVSSGALTHEALRALAIEAGADDAAAVSLDHPALAGERPHVLAALPGARTLVSLVMRMHRDNVRSPTRSVANLEFHRTGDATDEVAHRLATTLAARGHRAINPAMAFPMEMDRFPERGWIVSHKRVAEAAQLGRMGLHRSVIHPRFGSFILLGTVVTDAPLADGPPASLDYDPCVDCKLCVAACPVGAIEPEGGFRFSACYDHNYREFMTGFGDLLEAVADSPDRHALRDRVSLPETASMWQSLTYGANYKAAYCIAVCPAGEDVLGGFLGRRKEHLEEVVKPLTSRTEPVYAVAGSDAAEHAARRFPHKPMRIIESSLRPTTVRGFFASIPLSFQRGPARGLSATYHFTITGDESLTATVRIEEGTVRVRDGLDGEPDVSITCDARTWLEVVTKRRGPLGVVGAVLSRKLRIRGDRSLLDRFARCFPR